MSKLRYTPGRRAFLRGVGTLAVGLPLLELTHGRAWAAGETVQKRFVVFFEHGGTINNVSGRAWGDNGSDPYGVVWINDGLDRHHGWNDWAPIDPGETLVLGPIHQGLEAFRPKLMVVRGIDNQTAVRHNEDQGGHHVANATVLTAMAPIDDPRISGNQIGQGPSIEQVIAERLNAVRRPPFETIHLRVAGDSYPPPFYRAANQPISAEDSPRAAFDSLFAGVSGEAPDPAVTRARALKRSVLDGVLGGFNALRARVSTYDRAILDAHFDHISELEARIRLLELSGTCAPPSVSDVDRNHSEVVGPLLADILVAALRCGLSHVGSLDVADLITDWLPTPFATVAYDSGHTLDHHGMDVGRLGEYHSKADDWREEVQINRRWRMSLLQRILQGLDEIDEGGRTMLDNSLVLATSEFSSGADHSSRDLPILLAGSAGGYFRTGRHLNFNTLKDTSPNEYLTHTSTHNLFTSILQAFGQSDTHFGDERCDVKGPVPGLV